MNTKKKMTVWRLLSGALSMLGFSACSSDGVTDYPCAYGTLSVTYQYQVKGTVTDATGEPIEGIQVIVKDIRGAFMTDESTGVYSHRADTVYTNEKGEFTGHPAYTGIMKIQRVFFADVDGDKNGGTFKADSLEADRLTFKEMQNTEPKFEGKFEVTASVKLIKEEAEPEEEQ